MTLGLRWEAAEPRRRPDPGTGRGLQAHASRRTGDPAGAVRLLPAAARSPRHQPGPGGPEPRRGSDDPYPAARRRQRPRHARRRRRTPVRTGRTSGAAAFLRARDVVVAACSAQPGTGFRRAAGALVRRQPAGQGMRRCSPGPRGPTHLRRPRHSPGGQKNTTTSARTPPGCTPFPKVRTRSVTLCKQNYAEPRAGSGPRPLGWGPAVPISGPARAAVPAGRGSAGGAAARAVPGRMARRRDPAVPAVRRRGPAGGLAHGVLGVPQEGADHLDGVLKRGLGRDRHGPRRGRAGLAGELALVDGVLGVARRAGVEHFEFLRAAVVGDHGDGQVGVLGQADGKIAERGPGEPAGQVADLLRRRAAEDVLADADQWSSSPTRSLAPVTPARHCSAQLRGSRGSALRPARRDREGWRAGRSPGAPGGCGAARRHARGRGWPDNHHGRPGRS